MSTPIEHQPDRNRFVASIDGHEGEAVYKIGNGVMTIVHTEVDPLLNGRGIGGSLVQAALDYAKTQNLKVEPACSYAQHYMQTHPETQALRA